MDKLEKYVINHSSCGMPRCEYVENGTDIDCDDCQRIMLAEHDAKVRAEAIDEFSRKLVQWKPQNEEYMSFRDVVFQIAEQLKEQKNEM